MIIYDTQGNKLIQFDTYIKSTYNNRNGIAFEPLENGSFSNDSKQNTPYLMTIIGIKSISAIGLFTQTVNQVKSDLQALNDAPTLLTITLQPMLNLSNSFNTQWTEYGEKYTNISMFDLNWENNPEQLELRAIMTFQQIRLTDTEYSQQQNVANPQDTPKVNAGQVQPSTDTSILRNTIGQVPLI